MGLQFFVFAEEGFETEPFRKEVERRVGGRLAIESIQKRYDGPGQIEVLAYLNVFIGEFVLAVADEQKLQRLDHAGGPIPIGEIPDWARRPLSEMPDAFRKAKERAWRKQLFGF